jgi:outer membrane murein-binding lipoprotein Lpp
MQYLHEEDPIRLLEARGVVVDREIANVRQVAALERVEAEDLATSPRGELFYVTMADETGEPKRYVAIRDWVMKKKNQAAIQDLRPLTERENLDLRLRKIDEKEWSSVRAIEKLRPFPRELTSGPSGALTGVMVPGRKGGDIGRYQDVRFVEPGATSVYAEPFGPKEMAIQNEYMLAQAALDEERMALDLYYRRVGRPDKTVNRDGVDVFVRGTPANQHEGLKLEAEKLLRAAEDIETRSLEPIVDELIRNADPEARASAQRSLAEMKDQAERARELGRQKEASRMEIMSKRLKDRPDSSPSPAEKALLASTSELYKRAHTIERNVRQELATTLRGKLEATFQSLRTETEKLRAKAQAAKTEAARAKADAQAQAAEAALRSVEANRSGLSQIESFARAKADSDRIKAHKKLDEASRIEHAEANPDKIKSMSRRADQARAKYQEVLDDLAAAERRMRAEELERAPERAAERKDLREFLREFCREQLLKGAPATPEVQRWQRGEGHLERWAPELEKLEAAERAEAAEAAAAEATARALAAEAAEVDRAEALAKAERGPERPYQLDLSKLAPVKRVDPERAKAIRAQVAQAKAASPPPAAVVEAVVAAEASPVSPVPTEQMPVVELVEVVTEPVKVKKPRASRAKKPPKD